PRRRAPAISPAIAAGSSSTATMRATKAPRSVSLAAIQAELVSTVRPVSSSRPTATISVGVPDSDDMRRQVAALARDRVSGATAAAGRRQAGGIGGGLRRAGRGARWGPAGGRRGGRGRPGCEGVAVARRLAARGVPVSLIVDALAPAAVADVDVVVLGADAVT